MLKELNVQGGAKTSARFKKIPLGPQGKNFNNGGPSEFFSSVLKFFVLPCKIFESFGPI
jgi:hypothetical protein